MTAPLLEVTDLVRHYALPREKLFSPPALVKALKADDVDWDAGRHGRAWQFHHQP